MPRSLFILSIYSWITNSFKGFSLYLFNAYYKLFPKTFYTYWRKMLFILFLDLHLQISRNQSIYHWRDVFLSHYFVTLYFVPLFGYALSKANKLNLLVSLHEELCIDFNFIYYLLLFPSLSLSKSSPFNANLWAFSSLFLRER